MSNNDLIIELAEKIGQDLGATEEFRQKKEAEALLSQDAEARKLVKDFKTLKASFDRMEKMGTPLTEKNKSQLKTAEEKAMSNPNVKNWYEKTQRFYDLVIEVNKKMQQGIAG